MTGVKMREWHVIEIIQEIFETNIGYKIAGKCLIIIR